MMVARVFRPSSTYTVNNLQVCGELTTTCKYVQDVSIAGGGCGLRISPSIPDQEPAQVFVAFTAVPNTSAVCFSNLNETPSFFSPSNTLSVGDVNTFLTESITKSVYFPLSTVASFSRIERTSSRYGVSETD